MSGTAAIRVLVLTDLVDSTARVAALGDRRAAELFEQVDDLARSLLTAHYGREIDRTDGFLLLFEDVLSAIRYALALHLALAELPGDPPLRMRVGIHVGSVILRENRPDVVARGAKPLEVEGLAKPYAARIMGLAVGGQTLLSAAAVDLAQRSLVGEEDAATWVWMDHGRYHLKGIEQPVSVHEVGVPGAPLAPPPSTQKARAVSAPRSRRRLGAVLAGAGVLLALGTLGYWYAFAREVTTTVLASGLVHHQGSVEGLAVSEFSPAARPFPGLAFGQTHVVVTTKGGRITRLSRRNHKGNPAQQGHDLGLLGRPDWSLPLTIGKFLYAPGNPQDGALTQNQTNEASLGGTMEGYVASDYTFGLSATEETFAYGADGSITNHTLLPNGAIARVTVTEPEESGLLKRHFTPDGAPAYGFAGGWFAFTLVWPDPADRSTSYTIDRREGEGVTRDPSRTWSRHDSLKRLVETWFTDADGNEVTRRGVARVFQVYENAELPPVVSLRRAEALGGAPAREFACFADSYVNDEWGRLVEVRCLGPEGEPFASDNAGCFGMRNAWSDDAVRSTCLGPDWEPTRSLEGWTSILTTTDGAGYLDRLAFEGQDGEPIDTTLGFASQDFRFDANGYLVQLGPSRNAAGDLVLREDGAYSLRLERNAESRVTAAVRLDADGAAAMGADGAAMWKLAYDTAGRLVEQKALDASGMPALDVRGIHAMTLTRGELGEVAGIAFAGTDGGPTVHAQAKAASLAFERMSKGTVRSRTCFAPAGEPILCPVYSMMQEGDQVWCHRLDVVMEPEFWRTSCIGVDGEPRITGMGWASAEWRRTDGRGAFTKTLHGLDGELVDTAYGHAKVTDLNGVKTWTRADGSPGYGLPHGCSAFDYSDDDRGRSAGQVCYGPTGELQRDLVTGCAEKTNVWSEDGRTSTQTCLDPARQPTPNASGETSWVLTLGPSGQLSEVRMLGPDGGPFPSRRLNGAARRTIEHTADGFKVETDYDPRGEVLAQQSSRADILGRIVEWRMKGPKLGPPRGSLAPIEIIERDPQGRLSKRSFLDAEGQPVAPGPTATATRTYSYTGDERTLTTLDVHGRPTPNRAGCHGQRWVHDAADNVVLHACIDALGRPASPDPTRPATVTIERDPYGNATAYRPLDASGAPWPVSVLLDNSVQGAVVRLRIVDVDENPVAVGPTGLHFEDLQVRPGEYAQIDYVRDGRGGIVRESYSDADGQPVPGPDGFAAREVVRDIGGRPVDERWFDPAGEPTAGPQGCRRITRAFNPAGMALFEVCE